MPLSIDRAKFSAIFFFFFCCLITLPLIAQEPNQGLFLDPSSITIRQTPAPLDPTVIRRRIVEIDAALLPTPFSRQESILILNCFDDISLDVVLEELKQFEEGRYLWTGYVLGDEELSSVTIAVNNGVIVANIRSPRFGYFQIRITPDGFFEVREIDPTQFGTCGVTDEHRISLPPINANPAPTTRAIHDNIIDVMIAYTTAARIDAGGTTAMEALIDLALEDNNTSLENSLIDAQMRLVHTVETTYVESGSYSTDIIRLQDTSDGNMDTLHTLRDTYGADIVALLIEAPATGTVGLGYIMDTETPAFDEWAFSVNEYRNASSNLTLAHEMGHNLGCAHDAATGGFPGLETYSRGWQWIGNSGGGFASVMAYNSSSEISVRHFSNPSVTYDGVATGVAVGQANEADNATTINTVADTASAWRTAAEPLSVLPYTDYTTYGDAGGPYTPTSYEYTLTNTSNSTINWTGGVSESWITLSSSSGSLSAGNSTSITVTINANASTLNLSTHTSTITFTDTSNSDTHQRVSTLAMPVFEYTMNSDPGWSTAGQWAFGTPTGDGGFNGNPDPDSGYTGSNVYGVNLSGDYDNSAVSPAYLTLGPLDLSSYENTVLSFARWLNNGTSSADSSATVEVSNNNSTWTTIFTVESSLSSRDHEWHFLTYDVSSVADQQSTVYFRWGYTSNEDGDGGWIPFSGWNIDDVRITGVGTEITDLSEAWVDFAHVGSESGTESLPFKTLGGAVSALIDNGTGVIKIKGDTADNDSSETPDISKPMTIQAINGTVQIGTTP